MQITGIKYRATPLSLNVVTIPQDAPEEVKQIMDVKWYENRAPKLDNQKLLNARLKIAQKLQEKGYNPLDYHLDIESMNQQLQNLKASKDYRELLEKTNNAIEKDIIDIEEGAAEAAKWGTGTLGLGLITSIGWAPLLDPAIELCPQTIAPLLMMLPALPFLAIVGACTVADVGQSVVSTIKLLVDECKLKKYKSLTPTHPVIEKAVNKLKKEAPKLARL